MKDLFNSALDQWFVLESKAVAAKAAVEYNQEDLDFYAELVRVAAEQAEVAKGAELDGAIDYLRDATEKLKERVEDRKVLEKRANTLRREADLYREALRSVATF